MRALKLFLTGLAALGAAVYLFAPSPELSSAEAHAAIGGLPLPGMRCVTIGDCTIWNLANMALCPSPGGCTVCDSEETVRGCFIGSSSDVCDYQGTRTTDCGGVMTGECDAQDNCTINLTPVPGSVCTDGPKCS